MDGKVSEGKYMHRENELEEKKHHKIVKGCPEYIQGDPLKLPP